MRKGLRFVLPSLLLMVFSVTKFGGPSGDRTHDFVLKRHNFYQLNYRLMSLHFGEQGGIRTHDVL